jgi:hypothetical protein
MTTLVLRSSSLIVCSVALHWGWFDVFLKSDWGCLFGEEVHRGNVWFSLQSHKSTHGAFISLTVDHNLCHVVNGVRLAGRLLYSIRARLKLPSLCLHFHSAGITGVCHHAWLIILPFIPWWGFFWQYWRLNSGPLEC